MDLSLYVITDKKLAGGRSQVDICREAISGGAGVIQLRDKAKNCREAFSLGRALRNLTRQTGTLFIVNDRIDLAILLDADGVHLGQEDIPLKEALTLIPKKMIVGYSADSISEGQKAEKEGADYLGVGAVFPTGTKSDAGKAIGLNKLADICRFVNIPVVGIGGINQSNAASVVDAGAAGVAVISAVVTAQDAKQAAAVLFEQVTGRQR